MKEINFSFYHYASISEISILNVDDGKNISVLIPIPYNYIHEPKGHNNGTHILSVVLKVLVIQYCTTGTKNLKSGKLQRSIEDKCGSDILIHLWRCGDIEVNPGPVVRADIAFPKSYKQRRWIQEMSSVLLKMLKEIPENSKPKQLWKEKPDDWPAGTPFYDPRNKSTDIPTNDEQLLKCILKCCERKKISMHPSYEQEINAWIKGNKTLLIELHILRQEISAMKTAIHNLYKYRHTTELGKMISERNIKIDFGVVSFQQYKSNKCKSDIIRDMAAILCKIIHGVHPLKKTDGIWKTPPSNWDMSKAFYNPHNAGKRVEKHRDHNLLDNLYRYCKEHNIPILTEYEIIIHAWKHHNGDTMRKLYDICTNISFIEHSLKSLQFEGVLSKPDTEERLKDIGLTLTHEWHNNITAALVNSVRTVHVTSRGSSKHEEQLLESRCNFQDDGNTADIILTDCTIEYNCNTTDQSLWSENQWKLNIPINETETDQAMRKNPINKTDDLIDLHRPKDGLTTSTVETDLRSIICQESADPFLSNYENGDMEVQFYNAENGQGYILPITTEYDIESNTLDSSFDDKQCKKFLNLPNILPDKDLSDIQMDEETVDAVPITLAEKDDEWINRYLYDDDINSLDKTWLENPFPSLEDVE